MRLILSVILFVPLLVGCVITDTGVTNPVPGLSTVAIAPFLNLSTERAVDGRQFAEAYYAELQKVPGFEVVPVGVVETAMVQHGLEEMRGPEDAIRLAKVLNVDAVVIGAVTDYKPYAPPRLGIKVSWYSPYDWDFIPGIPIDPLARTRLENEQQLRENMYREANRRPLDLGDRCNCPPGQCDGRCLAEDFCPCGSGASVDACTGSNCCPEEHEDGLRAWLHRKHHQNEVKWERFKKEMKDPFELHKGPRTDKYRVPVPWPDYRGQSPEEMEPAFGHSMSSNRPLSLSAPLNSKQITLVTHEQQPEGLNGPLMPAPPVQEPVERPLQVTQALPSENTPPMLEEYSISPAVPRELSYQPEMLNTVPLMEYSRMFDATDADLVANFRDYYELSGDPRSGSWQSRLHRTDEFIRFVSHLMIKEMLMLHGGEARRRIIFVPRKFK
ncbi:MAG: hypothetical protein CMJ46_10500 [Planctomyces sp.]|nr:hypothetical protein [Planctomyces sp.]